jgi:hypothetical protein
MESASNNNVYLGSGSMTLEERLQNWIVARCHEQNPSPQREIELNAIFREIDKDRRFRRYRRFLQHPKAKNPDDYEDALSLMLQHFFRNLCEATTAKKSYYETRLYAVRRLLTSFKGNLKNIRIQRQARASRLEQPFIDSNDNFIDLIDKVSCPEPDLEPDPVVVFNEFRRLLAEDKEGNLNAETNTLRGIKESTKKTTQERYALTAQTYLLMRYRDDMTIQEIADELDIPHGSLQGGAKPAKWKALARKYAQMAKDSV